MTAQTAEGYSGCVRVIRGAGKAEFVSEHEQEETPPRLMFAEGVGMLIALLDSGAIDRRRYTVVNRLRRLQDTDDFASLPEDLRERVREITADAER
jgi:hypothetical protein